LLRRRFIFLYIYSSKRPISCSLFQPSGAENCDTSTSTAKNLHGAVIEADEASPTSLTPVLRRSPFRFVDEHCFDLAAAILTGAWVCLSLGSLDLEKADLFDHRLTDVSSLGSSTSLLSNVERDRLPGLLLNDGGTRSEHAAHENVLDANLPSGLRAQMPPSFSLQTIGRMP